MSAECWMFEVWQPLPFWPSRKITIDVRYVGPNRQDYNDPPTTNLRSIQQYLEIYAIYGIEEWCDRDAGTNNFYKNLNAYILGPENHFVEEQNIITLIIREFEDTNTFPKWYWDT